MNIKSSQTLVKEALIEITTISPSQDLEMSNNNECNLIHPESAYVQNNNLDLNKEIGFKKVSHIEGGFGNMSNSGFKVIK